jgi:hypothetical protein
MNLLILAPEPRCFGGMRLYSRTAHGLLREGPTVVRPGDVRHWLNDLPAPRAVVLCGRRFADQIGSYVIDLADLYVVPISWLRHLPCDEPGERAALAARVALAHALDPIERRLSDPGYCPF